MVTLRDDSDDDLADTHEINVTPFIDIMLVLLIVFMIAAPLATVDVPVDLPKTSAPPQPRDPKPVYVTLARDLTVSIGDEPASRDAIAAALDKVTASDKETRIYLRADEGVAYGDVMGVMNALRDAGYLKLALVGLDDGKAR